MRHEYVDGVLFAMGGASREHGLVAANLVAAITETRPVLLVEILSSTTAATDRREKLLAYQALPALVDYLIVSQDSGSVELCSCDADGWTYATFSSGEKLELEFAGTVPSIGRHTTHRFPRRIVLAGKAPLHSR